MQFCTLVTLCSLVVLNSLLYFGFDYLLIAILDIKASALARCLEF